MSALVLTLLRFGFLALVWIFVFAVLATIRRDIFGMRVKERKIPKPAPARREPTAPSRPAASAPRQTPPAPALCTLVVVEGPLAGTTLPLNSGSITVGRSPDSALVLDDGYASARHARFYQDGDAWFIEDLSSTNGTWIAGQRIYQPVQLHMGLPVTIGKTTMELR